jgi:predicted DNA-binding transcriptional regulator AlpA
MASALTRYARPKRQPRLSKFSRQPPLKPRPPRREHARCPNSRVSSQTAQKLRQTFRHGCTHDVSSVRISPRFLSALRRHRADAVPRNTYVEHEETPVSYRREAPSRRAPQARGKGGNAVTQVDRPATVGFVDRSFRLPTPPGTPSPTTATRTPAIHPLLSNSSAAAVILESRAHGNGRRTNGDDVLDALQFVRVSDVCQLLRISKPTLWRLRRAHEFPEPTELTNRVIAWRRSEVETWLRERASGVHAGTVRASNQSPLLSTEVDDVSRTTKKTQPVATSISRRRSKAVRRKSSDDQLVLPLMSRE